MTKALQRTMAMGALALLASASAVARPNQSEDTQKSLQAQTERFGVVAERGKKRYYAKDFDLSALPDYKPSGALNGWLKIHGNNYLADSELGELWEKGFARHQPGVKVSYYLPTAAIAFAALYYDQADLVMGHKPGFYDLLAYQRVKGHDPLEFSAVTGSFDVPGWESSTVIFVNDKNPIRCVTMEQLDGIFGAARSGGWAGTNFRPDRARGAGSNIRTWGQLSVNGAWANKPIQTYGFNIRYNTATDFADKVLGGADKWNENIKDLAHIVQPDGKRYIQAEQIADAIRVDPYAIGYTRFRGERSGLRRLAVAPAGGGKCVEHRLENVHDRSYPLYNEQYFYTTVAPDAKMNPMVKEFLRFALSKQGQELVQRDGKYLPLTAEVVREQLAKLGG